MQPTMKVLVLIILAILGGCHAQTIECEEMDIEVGIQETMIVLSWTINSCAQQYIVSHYVNNELTETIHIAHPFNFALLERYPCSHNGVTISLVKIANAGDFTDGTAEFLIGLSGDTKVRDLRFNTELSRFEWLPPEGAESPEELEMCDIKYEVYFENDITSGQSTITDEFYQISVYPCSNNVITITTVLGLDGSRSNEVSAAYQGPVARKPPTHVSTDPQENGARVTWRIDTETNNFCQIKQLIYEVEDVTDFVQPFQGYGSREFVILSLSIGTIYRHRLCYSFQPPILDTVCSEYINFLTQPLLRPSISLQTTDENQILISWEQNYHPDFVTGHSILIEPVGPNHFIPSHCPIDKEVIVRDVDAVASNYYFDANPSFEYNIQVETQFESLNMVTTSDQETIITQEYVPGDLDIQSSYEFTPSIVYSVTLIVQWSIPCDINGNVRSFEYTIRGTPNYEGICSDFVLGSGTVDGSTGNNGIYTITNPNVLPFFRYSFEISTLLQDHQSIIETNLKDPPEPFTP